MNEELGLAPSFAVRVFVGVIPISRIHNLPIDFVQVAEIVEKVAVCDLCVTFGKNPAQASIIYVFCRCTQMQHGLLPACVTINIPVIDRIKHRGPGSEVERNIIADHAARRKRNASVQSTGLDVLVADSRAFQILGLPIGVHSARAHYCGKIVQVRDVVDVGQFTVAKVGNKKARHGSAQLENQYLGIGYSNAATFEEAN